METIKFETTVSFKRGSSRISQIQRVVYSVEHGSIRAVKLNRIDNKWKEVEFDYTEKSFKGEIFFGNGLKAIILAKGFKNSGDESFTWME